MQQNTIKQVLYQAAGLLTESESAKLDCELLLSSAINKSREYLYSHPEYVLDMAEYSDFNYLLQKRAVGYPIAYLTGTREFWSLNFTVSRYTLVPRPETECLVETVLKISDPTRDIRILDLGTGSGAIAIAIANERNEAQITATDICPYALDVARENAKGHSANNVQFIQSDWFSKLHHKKFDFIISNPPYVESDDSALQYGDIRYEPRLALDGGKFGIDAYIKIIPQSMRHLTPDGTLLLEHGNFQGPLIRQLLADNGFTKIQTINDYAGNERASLGRICG
jgi:release factor glutamine methyltransferase